MRAGAQTLTLLGAPRAFLILRSLGEETKGRLELRRDAGAPAQSTFRNHVNVLEAAGVLVKHRRDSFPGALEYGLTDAGRDLLAVADRLESWLAEAPREPLELGSDRARAAVKGLVDSWSARVLTALAEGPLTLTQLDKQISVASYPTIERCLETMRLADQLEVGKRDARGTPYAMTDWLRRGIAPLGFGARWEYRNRTDGAVPIFRTDLDDALRLATPKLELPPKLSGVCQLAVKVSDGEKQNRILGLLEVEEERIALGPPTPQRKPDARASGSIDDWFSTMLEGEPSNLKLSGNRTLAQTVFDRLHAVLFKDGRGAPVEQTRAATQV